MDHKSKLDEATIKEVETAISACKDAASKEDHDVEALKATITALQTASMSIGKAVYKGGAASGGSGEEKTEEATKAEGKEGEEKKEEKK